MNSERISRRGFLGKMGQLAGGAVGMALPHIETLSASTKLNSETKSQVEAKVQFEAFFKDRWATPVDRYTYIRLYPSITSDVGDVIPAGVTRKLSGHYVISSDSTCWVWCAEGGWLNLTDCRFGEQVDDPTSYNQAYDDSWIRIERHELQPIYNTTGPQKYIESFAAGTIPFDQNTLYWLVPGGDVPSWPLQLYAAHNGVKAGQAITQMWNNPYCKVKLANQWYRTVPFARYQNDYSPVDLYAQSLLMLKTTDITDSYYAIYVQLIPIKLVTAPVDNK